MAIRTELYYVPTAWRISEQTVGRYEVICFGYQGNMLQPVYSVFLNGEKVRCWSSADERTFPKRAAQAGHLMVLDAQNRIKEATQ